MESAAARCPRDVLVLVFKHLPPSSLKRCALVCKRWHAAASCDAVWARHVSARHDVNISSTLKGRWLHRDYLLRPRPAFADLPPYFPLADRHVLPGPLALLRFYLVDPVRLAAVIRPMRAKRCASRREYVRAQVRYMAPLVALVPTAMVMFAALRGEFPLERVVALVPGWLAATSVEGLVHEHVTGRPLGPLAPNSLVLPALLAAHLPQTERPLWVSMLRFGTFDYTRRRRRWHLFWMAATCAIFLVTGAGSPLGVVAVFFAVSVGHRYYKQRWCEPSRSASEAKERVAAEQRVLSWLRIAAFATLVGSLLLL